MPTGGWPARASRPERAPQLRRALGALGTDCLRSCVARSTRLATSRATSAPVRGGRTDVVPVSHTYVERASGGLTRAPPTRPRRRTRASSCCCRSREREDSGCRHVDTTTRWTSTRPRWPHCGPIARAAAARSTCASPAGARTPRGARRPSTLRRGSRSGAPPGWETTEATHPRRAWTVRETPAARRRSASPRSHHRRYRPQHA